MNKWQQQVHEFNDAIRANPSKQLVIDLIKEEVGELVSALENDDEVGIIDGAVDSIVVILGAIKNRLHGIDLEPFFDEVQRTNMAKADGPIREDGKRLKPPGWTPPDIKGILERMRGKSLACRNFDPWGCSEDEVGDPVNPASCRVCGGLAAAHGGAR